MRDFRYKEDLKVPFEDETPTLLLGNTDVVFEDETDQNQKSPTPTQSTSSLSEYESENEELIIYTTNTPRCPKEIKRTVRGELKHIRRAGSLFNLVSTVLLASAPVFSILGPLFGPVNLLLLPVGLALSIFIRLKGYLSWGISVTLRAEEVQRIKNNPRQTFQLHLQREEYKIVPLKKEKYAAWIGTAAAIAVVAAIPLSIFFPPLALVATTVGLWLFVASNVLWTSACHDLLIKEKQLLGDLLLIDPIAQLKIKKQIAYRNFNTLFVFASIFLASATTISIFCPPAAAFFGIMLFGMLSIQTAVGLTISAVGLFFLAQSIYLGLRAHIEKNNITPTSVWESVCGFFKKNKTEKSDEQELLVRHDQECLSQSLPSTGV